MTNYVICPRANICAFLRNQKNITKFAFPSQAKPSQAKPSQAKPKC
jgi:hypothetical protein